MRLRFAVVIFLIGLSILVVGCASSSQNNSTSTPASKATPQATMNPLLFGKYHGNQFQMDIFSYASHGEAVNYTVQMRNNGSTDIRNLFIMLDEMDNSTHLPLYSTTYYINQSIPANSEAEFSMLGGPHGSNLTSFDLHLCFYWGNDDEFYTTYNLPVKRPP